MASQIKFLLAFALVAMLLISVQAQDYDDESGGQGNDGYGGFSGGGGGEDDYAAPRDRGIVGAEGSDINPGYHQGDDAGSDNYENDDSAAAASHQRPTIARPNLVKLIKQSRK